MDTNKNIAEYRKDFPALSDKMHGKDIVFLDSAASAQKPYAVINKVSEIMSSGYANIHRGLYLTSQELTKEFEDSRLVVAAFLNAKSEEIIFTRNATEGINLVASSFGGAFLNEGDEVILTQMEHHANIVPWQLLRNNKQIEIKVIPTNEKGELEIDSLGDLLSEKTRLVSFVHISNALGTVNPAKEIIAKIKKYNPQIKVLLDCTQSAVHSKIDVRDLDCDFAVITAHKLYAPTGIGALYGKAEILRDMPPYQGGGDMIESVSFEKTTFKDIPHKFEAGTTAFVQAIGFAQALKYINNIGSDKISAHEHELLTYGTKILSEIDGLRIIGQAKNKAAILSFVIEGINNADIAMILDRIGIALRVGHHCCMPLMKRYNLESTCRASLGLYSSREDLDRLKEGLNKAVMMLR